ncbi:hypothetical protein [Castellaniella defragrans]|uniref:Uncharacterized protein n=2 Tax=Castellaniella defragrans TaxID=75697 RepID=W8X2R3_CASD6|nr:hypothetical protein [Castellaniella defragrans]KAB0615362.1 hypothetical protein F7Q88_09100 [Castellaniella defragrans]MBB6082960.1 hypothetical protein [Castellaniella defragrans]CDM23702.1 hypothetical protein BN940_06166 [Castellaniella defragrans 65Phen]
MDFASTLLIAAVAWLGLRAHYQRTRIALLGRHLAGLQLERHMETLTQGYTRAIHEASEARQIQVLETFAAAERSVAAQVRTLAEAMQQEGAQATCMSMLPVCLPYAERILPLPTRDFRALLRIHAAGLRHVVDNGGRWSPKDRAYHLSAELYLLQHSCHWYCKSRAVADARLTLRHQVTHRQALDAASDATRSAYLQWMRGAA